MNSQAQTQVIKQLLMLKGMEYKNGNQLISVISQAHVNVQVTFSRCRMVVTVFSAKELILLSKKDLQRVKIIDKFQVRLNNSVMDSQRKVSEHYLLLRDILMSKNTWHGIIKKSKLSSLSKTERKKLLKLMKKLNMTQSSLDQQPSKIDFKTRLLIVSSS